MQDHGRKDVEPMNKFDMMGKDALSKVEEIMNATKLNEFLHRKEEEEKKLEEDLAKTFVILTKPERAAHALK